MTTLNLTSEVAKIWCLLCLELCQQPPCSDRALKAVYSLVSGLEMCISGSWLCMLPSQRRAHSQCSTGWRMFVYPGLLLYAKVFCSPMDAAARCRCRVA